jgi:hypothetical protein
MKYLLILLTLLAGCKVSSDGSVSLQPIVLETPVVISPIEAASVPQEVMGAASVPQAPPAEKVRKNVIIQYTIESCGWCKYDRTKVLPAWVKKGWTWENTSEYVIDETKSPKGGGYPRYEIYDANGTKKIHTGSLLSWRP